ncbi:MAG: septum formation initiator family protein [Proteobacteria bacterium]|nr:septum formation initiator family protein [Pseudomonadota bacterium]MDA1058648.1 septum formation initiator family protein [Pseudomonadota bacterium]
MGLAHEVTKRTRAAIAPFLLILMVAYFGISFVQGDRGLLAWIRLNDEIAVAKADLGEVQVQRALMEHRTQLLRPDGLDLDMLDERARSLLGFADRDEIVLYTSSN